MAGTPLVGQRARTTRTTSSDYVRTTLLVGAHSSYRLLVASVPRQLCNMNHSAAELPKPHPPGAHSSPRLLVASVPRQLVIWTTPQRNGPCPTPQSYSLRAQPACCTAHLRELPAQAARSPVDLYVFLRFRAEAYAQRATIKHAEINPSRDHRRGLRLQSEPIGLQSPLLTEPDRPSRDPLGLRAPRSRSSSMSGLLPCGPPWEGTGGARGIFGLSRLSGDFFQYRALSHGL